MTGVLLQFKVRDFLNPVYGSCEREQKLPYTL